MAYTDVSNKTEPSAACELFPPLSRQQCQGAQKDWEQGCLEARGWVCELVFLWRFQRGTKKAAASKSHQALSDRTP